MLERLCIALAISAAVVAFLPADASELDPCETHLAALRRTDIEQLIARSNDGRQPAMVAGLGTAKGKPLAYFAAVLGKAAKLEEWLAADAAIVRANPEIVIDTSIAGQTESLRVLLDAGADPNARSDNGATPLIAAADCKRHAAMSMLIARGADLNAESTGGIDAMIVSAILGDITGIRILLDAGFDLSQSRTVTGFAPLDIAIQTGNEQAIAMFRSTQVAPNRGPARGQPYAVPNSSEPRVPVSEPR